MESQLAPLLGVALGWCLAELSQLLRGRREDRRAMGRALAHVLEAERQLYLLLELTDQEYVALPEGDRRQFEAGLPEALRAVAATQTGFESTVELVAGIDPLLGARLRAKGTAIPEKLLSQLSASHLSAAELQELRKAIAVGLGQLNELALTLAGAHGVRTWWRIKYHRANNTHPATVLKQARAASEQDGGLTTR